MPFGEGDVDFAAFVSSLASVGSTATDVGDRAGDVSLDERIAAIEHSRAFLTEVISQSTASAGGDH